jgi:hypothetical protein
VWGGTGDTGWAMDDRGDQEPDRPIDAPGPPAEPGWEGDAGTSAWDAFAPPAEGPFIPGEARTDEAGRFGPTEHGHPFEASTRPPFVWLAAASLAVGLLSLVACNGLTGVVALVFGFKARSRIRDAPPGSRRGDEVAVAGMVLGAVGIGIGILRFAFALRAGA